MAVISPTVARFGVLASITIGIGLIALYSMAISGGMESDTMPEAVNPPSADSGEDLLQQGGGSDNGDISFDEFMQRVKAQESFTQNHIDTLYKLAGSHGKKERTGVLIQEENKPQTPEAAKPAKTTPAKAAKAAAKPAQAALSGEADALEKMAASAKEEVKTSKEWSKEVKPLDDRAVAAAQQMLRDAKEEKRQAELKRQERKDKEIVDETKILSRNLDKLPDPPKSPVANAANAQVAKKVGVPKNYTKSLTRAVKKKAQIEKDEHDGKISKTVAKKLKKKADVAIKVAKKEVNNQIAHAVVHTKITKHSNMGGEEMPPVPDSEDQCDTVHQLAVPTCELEFWKAKDACTSETLAPEKAFQTTVCNKAKLEAMNSCMEHLQHGACSTAKAAKQEASTLGDTILQEPKTPEKASSTPVQKTVVKKVKKIVIKKKASKKEAKEVATKTPATDSSSNVERDAHKINEKMINDMKKQVRKVKKQTKKLGGSVLLEEEEDDDEVELTQAYILDDQDGLMVRRAQDDVDWEFETSKQEAEALAKQMSPAGSQNEWEWD